MADKQEFVVRKNEGNGQFSYYFCVEKKKFAHDKIKAEGLPTLVGLFAATSGVDAMMLGDRPAVELTWDEYAAKIQVGP